MDTELAVPIADKRLIPIENSGKFMNKTRMTAYLCCAASAFLIAGCGGGNSSDASIGGDVTGLAAGTTVRLDNGSDTLQGVTNGNFVFSGKVPGQSSYNVTVGTQPAGQTCLITNGSGTIDYSGDSINNVTITCAANPSVGGVVAGLAPGAGVTLQNNYADTLVVSANGAFAFPILLTLGAVYNITVSAQPVGQACIVANATGGIVSLTPITNVAVTCVSTT